MGALGPISEACGLAGPPFLPLLCIEAKPSWQHPTQAALGLGVTASVTTVWLVEALQAWGQDTTSPRCRDGSGWRLGLGLAFPPQHISFHGRVPPAWNRIHPFCPHPCPISVTAPPTAIKSTDCPLCPLAPITGQPQVPPVPCWTLLVGSSSHDEAPQTGWLEQQK